MSEPYVHAFVYICVHVRESGLTNPTSPLSRSRLVDGKTYNRVHNSHTRNQSDFIQLGQHSVGHGCAREHGLKRVFCPHPRPSSDPSCPGTPASAGQCQLKKNAQRERCELFYLGQNEDYSLGDSISDSSEELVQRGRGEGQYRCDFGEGGVHAIKHIVLAEGYC